MTSDRFSVRLLGLAVLLALALAVGACGDDGDSGGGSGGGSSQTAEKSTNGGSTGGEEPAQLANVSPDSDEGKIKAVYLAMQRSITNGNADRVCSYLTPKAQTESARTAGEQNCLAVADKLSRAMMRADKTRAGVLLSIEVDGDEAVATIKSGQTKTLPATFVRTPQGWKYDDTILPPQ